MNQQMQIRQSMDRLKQKIRRKLVEDTTADPGDFLQWIVQQHDSSRRRTLLAAAPKSASTYLTRVLSQALSLKIRYVADFYGRNEQQIYLPRLLCALDQDVFVGQQHLRASEAVLDILSKLEFRVIVCVRNLYDTVVSFRDHQLAESVSHPMAMLTREQLGRLSKDEHLWFVVRMVLPWYFNFYVSWVEAEKSGILPIHWVTYEDLTRDPGPCLGRILDFLEVDLDDATLASCLDKPGDRSERLNVGISGRGECELTPTQRRAILEMAAFYKGVNFERLGLVSQPMNL
jgi:hypothetical protein